MARERWTARVGLNYPGPDGAERRAEAGDTVDDLPAASVKWLAEQGLIEPAPAAEQKAAKR